MDPNDSRSRDHLKRPRMHSLDQDPDRPPPQQREVHTTQEAGSGHQWVNAMVPYLGAASGHHLDSAEGWNAPRLSSNHWDSNAVGIPRLFDGLTLPPIPSGVRPFHNTTTGQFGRAPAICDASPLTLINSNPCNAPIPNTQRLIPSPGWNYAQPTSVPSQRPQSMVSINTTHFSGGTNIENHGVLNVQAPPMPSGPVPVPPQLQQHVAPNAIHTSAAVDNQGVCMPKTRALTLQRLQSLATSVESDDPDVIWMHGPAGAGKSAIMRTLANSFHDRDVLLGSFFFSRADPTRNTFTPFIPTLALQAFTFLPATQSHMQNAIQSNPTVFSQSIRHQHKHLIEVPLKRAVGHEPKWTTETPLVLVIDGLDECTNADRQVDIIQAARKLASTIHPSTNHRVKILIASRREMAINDEFESDRKSTTIIELTPSDANIDLYYKTRLKEIRRAKNITADWPSPNQLNWLKEKTSGQYSFAHISMAFLVDGDPVQRLEMLENGINSLLPFAPLDALYVTIFRQIPPEMADNGLLLVYLWLLKPNLAQVNYNNMLERILSLPRGFPPRLLSYLASIFDIGYFYRPFHASLGDFLEDPLRSREFSLFLDPRTVSTAIVEGLLGLCMSPTPPTDKNTAESWFKGYDELTEFLYQSKSFLHFSPRPKIADSFDQLHSLLPTMDLYSFGYYNRLLSFLFENQDPLSSDLSHFHTIQKLLDEILSIQRRRFSVYKVLEEVGDSGLAFFGLLLVFVSNSCIDLGDTVSSGSRQCSVEKIVAHLLSIQEDIPSTPPYMEEALSLRSLARKLSTIKQFKDNCDNRCTISDPPINSFALLSTPIADNFPELLLCPSRTIEMFLDLPMQKTRIQGLISAFISCPDHATIHPNCDCCASNLEKTRTSVIYAVANFVQHSPCPESSWLFDARTFARCHPFVADASQCPNVDLGISMINIGKEILDRIKKEPKGTGTSIIENLYTMLSSLHEWTGWHDDDDLESDPCEICSRVRHPNPSCDSDTGRDAETDFRG